MCATLERFNAETEKIVSAKDREIQNLKQQVVVAEKGREDELSSLTKRLEDLENKLRSKVNELTVKDEELQSKTVELKSKDEELKELLKAVECVQAKVTSLY